MKNMYQKIVRVIYILTYPASSLLLHNSKRVRVLIIAEDKILLQRSSFGHQQWSLPGGGVSWREALPQAAIREAQEEVGIALSQKQLVKIGSARLPKNTWPQMNITFYRVILPRVTAPVIHRPLEIIEAQWWPLKKVPKNRSQTVDTALALGENPKNDQY